MFPFAKETRAFLLLVAASAAVVNYQFGLIIAAPLWILLSLMAFYLRDLPRNTPSLPLANISPVDGRVKSVDKAHDPYLKRDSIKVSIRQRLLGEFSTHSPIEGKVMNRWSSSGYPETSNLPQYRFAVWIQTDEKDDVVIEIDLSTIPRYFQCKIQPGERIGQGKRCGFIGFGRLVNVYLPANSRALVQPGTRVKAGQDVIGEFSRDE